MSSKHMVTTLIYTTAISELLSTLSAGSDIGYTASGGILPAMMKSIQSCRTFHHAASPRFPPPE